MRARLIVAVSPASGIRDLSLRTSGPKAQNYRNEPQWWHLRGIGAAVPRRRRSGNENRRRPCSAGEPLRLGVSIRAVSIESRRVPPLATTGATKPPNEQGVGEFARRNDTELEKLGLVVGSHPRTIRLCGRYPCSSSSRASWVSLGPVSDLRALFVRQ